MRKSVRSVAAASLVPVSIVNQGYGHVRKYVRTHYRQIRDDLTQNDIDKNWDKFSPDQKFEIGFDRKFVMPKSDLIGWNARQLAGWQSQAYTFTSDDRERVEAAAKHMFTELVENGVSSDLITNRCKRLLAEFTTA